MCQHEVVVDVEQCQLMLQAVLALAQRVDPTPYCRHALADVEVEPLYKGGIDLPATGSQDVLDCLQRAEHHPVLRPDYPLTPVLLEHLRIEQPRQRHPAWLRHWALGPLALRLVPHTEMAQDSGQVALKPVAQPQ